MNGDEIVRRARARLGVRFRAQGRGGGSGLDCIGLAAAAIAREPVRADYRLRGGSMAALELGMEAAGLRRVLSRQPGDVLTMRAGPEQLHLGIWTGSGLIHADAGLRCAVERPGEPPWPVLGIWRLED